MAFDVVAHISLAFQRSGTGSLIKPTFAYTAGTLTMLNATLRHVEDLILEEGLSAYEIPMPPFVASNPGAVMWLFADHPVDLGIDTASMLVSGIRMGLMVAPVDTLFVTTTLETALHVELMGGSGASLLTNFTPL